MSRPRPNATLSVDVDALAANLAQLRQRAGAAEVAPVVKGNAYGLGLETVVGRLVAEGVQRFFVANVEEGIALRALAAQPTVYVLDGGPAGDEGLLESLRLVPVLNSLSQLESWARRARGQGRLQPAVLHIDTGINRLGLTEREVEMLVAAPARMGGLAIELVMTHLACADEPDHPLNPRQIEAFHRLRRQLPAQPTSIGNSAGLLIGPEYRGDIVRPGIALYGGNPFVEGNSPMREVVRVRARVLQVIETGCAGTVGYGATHAVAAGARLATVGIGYADGYLRALGNRGTMAVAGRRVPVVGRVSMDLVTLDVTDVPAGAVQPDTWVDVIGGEIPVDEVAHAAGTISYELLTSLGDRLKRIPPG